MLMGIVKCEIKGKQMTTNTMPNNTSSNTNPQETFQEQVKTQMQTLADAINKILDLRNMTSNSQPK
jgi:hypothetical protein